MPDAMRWLLLRTGSRLLAAPLEQVAALSVAGPRPDGAEGGAADLELPLSLSEHLWGEEESAPGVILRVRGVSGVGVRVAAAEEISEGQAMIPLPALLRRAVADGSPLIGAILWRGRPVPVVNLLSVVSRPAACRGAGLLDELVR